ncbi:hypothetical protein GCM10010505_05940 [Kitasatospora aburaviensis]
MRRGPVHPGCRRRSPRPESHGVAPSINGSEIGVDGLAVLAEEYRESLPADHHPLYDRLLSRAAEVHRTGMTASDSAAHMAGSEVLVGHSEVLLAVWDGKPAWGYGGTADVVDYARRCGVPVQVLWPKGAER